MMKITDLSHLFKWENLHNWWLTKYFFAPLYIYTILGINYLNIQVSFSLKKVNRFRRIAYLFIY